MVRIKVYLGVLAVALLLPRLAFGEVGGAVVLPTPLPTPLGAADVARYQEIFALQQDTRWHDADLLIAELENPILLGRVLAQRYLHPTGWRSRYGELRDWLALYNDHPAATRIYRLARKRKPADAKAPQAPKKKYLNGYGRVYADARYVRIPISYQQRASLAKTRAVARDVRRQIRTGHPTAAVKILENADNRRHLTKMEEAVLRVDIAHGYFIYGKNYDAIRQAERALDLLVASGAAADALPRGLWVAGIAAWRAGDMVVASDYMHRLADADPADHALASAGAFWASRADLRAGKADQSIHYLAQAARYQDTFYGMLAAEALGQDITLDFSLPQLDAGYIDWLNARPGGRRAFALLQVGETYHASRELRYLWEEHRAVDKPKLMALAAQTHMAGLAFRAAGIIHEESGKNWYGGLYPIPDFRTALPLRVDHALLLAIMRQESAFNPRAQSWAKASGLMQLMPRTAAYIARDRSYRDTKRHDLLIPEVNIRIGEDYILYLLEAPVVGSDLIRLLAAYNAGPGNLRKWSKDIEHGGDVLILLESLRARETRFYVKNVMINFWIYSKLRGKEAPSVAALAAGDGAVIHSIHQPDCPITNLAEACADSDDGS